MTKTLYFARVYGVYGRSVVGPYKTHADAFDAAFRTGAWRWVVKPLSRATARQRTLLGL